MLNDYLSYMRLSWDAFSKNCKLCGLYVEKGITNKNLFAWFYAAEKEVLYVPLSKLSFSLWLTVAGSC